MKLFNTYRYLGLDDAYLIDTREWGYKYLEFGVFIIMNSDYSNIPSSSNYLVINKSNYINTKEFKR